MSIHTITIKDPTPPGAGDRSMWFMIDGKRTVTVTQALPSVLNGYQAKAAEIDWPAIGGVDAAHARAFADALRQAAELAAEWNNDMGIKEDDNETDITA